MRLQNRALVFHYFGCILSIISILQLLFTNSVFAQNKPIDTSAFYNEVKTYVNPVLPGDHPDPTLLKVGTDFYHCGSSFHFNPYLPIYHSKDLVHWEVISRVISDSIASWVTDRPSVGIWQGALTYFYGSYWIYFSSNGQWFCKSDSPYGPWTNPVEVKTNAITGPLGYDNSIFIDDDGKPYMLIKNLQKVNRIQALGHDGQLTDTVINLDWINANLRYSWAEGPVMCKRHGYYYYFPAGDVMGGQYVLRTRELSSDSTKWERLGDFFKPVTDSWTGFRRPNHISAPLHLADGSWWTIGQSYERYPQDDWSGMGRQTSLFQVFWEDDRPWGIAPTNMPNAKPDLPQSGILWRSVQSDYFENNSLNPCWHFISRKDAAHYSLQTRKGWITLTPDSGRTSLLQKETDHFYSAVTRVESLGTGRSDKAGLYLTNGNQTINAILYSCAADRQIVFKLDTAYRSVPNKFGKTVWLKMERRKHLLRAYYSVDGNDWLSVGSPVDATVLDSTQRDFNSWVGTSIGLFAEGKKADFDLFICKDGFSSFPAEGFSNYYGVALVEGADGKGVTNTSRYGGWFMISGVELGRNEKKKTVLEVTIAAAKTGNLEVWLDDLKHGRHIATIPIQVTGGKNHWKTFRQSLSGIRGHHDVFVKFQQGDDHKIFVRQLRFVKEK